MTRAASLCSLALIGWFGVPAAHAARPREPALGAAARALQRVILPDVYEVGPVPSSTAMDTAAACCGWAERHVYYRAAPGNYATYGGYELSLEDVGPHDLQAGAVIRKVTISEFPTLAAAPFVPDPYLPATFTLSIWHDSLKESKDWHGAVEYHYNPGCPVVPDPSCVPWEAGRVLTGHPRIVQTVLKQGLAVMEKARRHAPISPENPSLANLRSRPVLPAGFS